MRKLALFVAARAFGIVEPCKAFDRYLCGCVAALRAALQGAQRACRRGAAAGEAKPRGSRKFLSRIVSADISFDNIFARPLAICTELLGLRRRPWPRKAKKGHVGPTAEPLGEVSGMGWWHRAVALSAGRGPYRASGVLAPRRRGPRSPRRSSRPYGPRDQARVGPERVAEARTA